ncbi:cyclic nucleotide-binding/CBS domain-containing protein [Methanosphaera cuniculi]|uniref:CBS domain-containing protein n=1 Tax=Methanosphaera cuniculi TaxID=1077256 RepID=UPI0026EA59A5|nr:CBS domain-containing protein [Methanosphaera cuniculi]
MDLKIKNDIEIKDAMTHNVIKSTSDVAISDIAKLMTKNDISSVVIEDEIIKGIVTTNNIISKVVSKNLSPQDVTADMVMEDYVGIKPETSLAEASKIMIEKNSKVVLVTENDELKGILTLTDIVRVSPELIQTFIEEMGLDDVFIENSQTNTSSYDDDEKLDEGVCEHCGVYGSLDKYDGLYLCSDCIDELKSEDED